MATVDELRQNWPALPVKRCGQLSTHAPHHSTVGPDQPRICPGRLLGDAVEDWRKEPKKRVVASPVPAEPATADSKALTAEAFADPQAGDEFTEMYSFWVVVVAVEPAGRVAVLTTPGGRMLPDDGELIVYESHEAYRTAYAYPSIPGQYWVRLHRRGLDVAGWFRGWPEPASTAPQAVPAEPATPAEGPWIAVMSDRWGDLRDSVEDFDSDDEIEIAVVRGTAAPQGTRRPGSYRSIDVLCEWDDLDTDNAADRWEQAKAVAAALNARPTVPGPAPTTGVLAEIAAERRRQDEKWGEQNHPDGTGPRVPYAGRLCFMEEAARDARLKCKGNSPAQDNWRDILLEEVFEALAEESPAELRTELIQVAAVAAQWVEAIDRRPLSSLPPGTEADRG